MVENVAHLLPLRPQVPEAFITRRNLDRHALHHSQAVSFQSHQLPGVVRHDPNSAQPQIRYDLRTDSILPEVGRESQLLVSFHGVSPPILQLIRAKLVQQTDTPPFLCHIQQYAFPLLLNHDHGRSQLLSAITPSRTEDITSKT